MPSDMLGSDRDATPSRLEQLCLDKGLKMTDQRRIIARVLSDSADHPDVEQVYRRGTAIGPKNNIAPGFRTGPPFEGADTLARPHFRAGPRRPQASAGAPNRPRT